MKLIRFDGNKTGLVVELASGIHVVDVVASIGALVPDDPISHGVLNGLLKDNGSWAQLIQHWEMARKGLRKLAALAQASGPTQVVLRRLAWRQLAIWTGSAASTSRNWRRSRRIRRGGMLWNGNLARRRGAQRVGRP
jgi:hypothetical protein